MKWRIWLVFLTLPLFSSELEDRISALEAQMSEVGTKTPEGGYGARLTTESFQRGWVSICFSGEALYWNTKLGGNEYVYDLARKYIGLSSEKKEELEEQNFDWDWGYRGGVALGLNFIGWDLVGNYTHFKTQDIQSCPKDLFLYFNDSASLEDTHSFYKIVYDSVDVELKRSSFLSRFFGMGTSLGMKIIWIDQAQEVSSTSYHLKDHCFFHGLGPRLGGHLKWHLLYGISLLGNVSGSILYGDYDVKHTGSSINIEGQTQLFAANLGFFMGMGWDYYGKKCHVALGLGYEGEYCWRQNRVVEVKSAPRLQIVRYADDLTFYGITCKARIEF